MVDFSELLYQCHFFFFFLQEHQTLILLDVFTLGLIARSELVFNSTLPAGLFSQNNIVLFGSELKCGTFASSI